MKRSVKAVGANRSLRRAWIEAAYRCHDNDPLWVPPLRAEVKKSIDARTNPFLRHADVEHFVLFENDKAIGRIAATV